MSLLGGYVAPLAQGAAQRGSSESATTERTRARRAKPRPDALQLIEKARRRGEISRDRSLLYSAYALFRPAKLPARFRSATPIEATLALLELQDAAKKMKPGRIRTELKRILFPKADAGADTATCGNQTGALAASYDTAHFHIEYSAVGGGLTVEDYGDALEASWDTEVGAFGWASPPVLGSNPLPGGRYSVRLDALGGSLYGFVTSAGTHAGSVGNNPSTPWNEGDAQATCMVMNNDFTQLTIPPGETALDALEATAAHEFNHSIQFGYGALNGSNRPDAVFIEGGATWMEDEVFDSADDSYNYLWPKFSASMGAYTDSPYPYWITWRGLTERHGWSGEQLMQDFWEELSRGASLNLDALRRASSNRGVRLPVAFHDYAIAAKFNRDCDDGYSYPHCFEEGSGYVGRAGAPGVHGSIGSVGASYSGSILDDYAINWVALPTSSDPYEITLSNGSDLGGQLRASAVCDDGGSLEVVPFPAVTGPNDSTTLVWDAPDSCAGAVAVITNEDSRSAKPSSVAARPYALATDVLSGAEAGIFLDCDDDSGNDYEVNPAFGDKASEWYRCEVRDGTGAPMANTLVAAENLNGANDHDDDGVGGPDAEADHWNWTDDNGVINLYVGNNEGQGGIADICFWVSLDDDLTFDISSEGSEGSDDGGYCDASEEPYDEAEGNDREEKGRILFDAFLLLDCDDGSGDDHQSVSLYQSDWDRFTCKVTRSAGQPVEGVWVDAENLNGANDPDDDGVGGPSSGPDHWAKTDAFGEVDLYISAWDREGGSADVCFWVDADADSIFDINSTESQGSSDGGYCDDIEEPVDEVENGDREDKLALEWNDGLWIDCDAPDGSESILGHIFGDRANASFDCRVTDYRGDGVPNLMLSGENLGGANDPDDDSDGGPESWADYWGYTDSFGRASVDASADEQQGGTADVCIWVDMDQDSRYDATATDSNGSDDGGYCDDNEEPLNETEGWDREEKVRASWNTGLLLDCDDETGDDLQKGFLATAWDAREYTCSASDEDGGPVSGISIGGENLNGANDPDDDAVGSSDGSVGNGMDYYGYTDPDGRAGLWVSGLDEEGGSAKLCFWADTDGDSVYDSASQGWIGSADGGYCDDAEEPVDEVENNDREDAATSMWSLAMHLDCRDRDGDDSEVLPVGASSIYTCELRDEYGDPIEGVGVFGENMAGANDADDDAVGGEESYPDYYGDPTDENGISKIAVDGWDRDLGDAEICFWADMYSYTFDVTGSAAVGGDCDEELVDEPGATDRTDKAALSWMSMPADLSVVKTATVDLPAVGDAFDYELRVTNHGPNRAHDVALYDSLPRGVDVDGAPSIESLNPETGDPSDECSLESFDGFDYLSCDLTTMEDGESVLVTIPVTRVRAGAFTNFASLSSADDPDLDDDFSDVVTPADPDMVTDVSLTKSGPDSPPVGEAFDYTLTVTNEGTRPAEDVVVTDVLPVGVTYEGHGLDSTDENDACSFEEPEWDDAYLSCDLGALPAGESVTITFTVTRESPYAIRNFASVDLSNDADDEDNFANFAIPVDPSIATDVEITKSAPAAPAIGSQFDYTLVATNVGDNAAEDVRIFDELPSNVTVQDVSVDDPALSDACTTTDEYETTYVTCDLGTLGAGSSVTVTITVTRDDGFPIYNSAWVVSANDVNEDNDVDWVFTDFDPSIATDVSIDKTAPDGIAIGEEFDYTLTATNEGTNDAIDVEIFDTLPTNVALVDVRRSDDPDGETPCFDDTFEGETYVSCRRDLLEPGASFSVTITVTRSDGFGIVNWGGVDAANDDDMTNNYDSVFTDIDPSVATDLALTKSGPQNAAVGTTLDYVLHVANEGTNPAEGVVVSDYLPAGLTFVSAARSDRPDDPEPCVSEDYAVDCELGSIPAGTSRDVTITVRREEAYVQWNYAAVSSLNDANPDNDWGEAFLAATGSVAADLEIDKSVVGGVPPLNAEFDYKLRVTNHGPNASAQDAAVEDILPEGVEFVSIGSNRAGDDCNDHDYREGGGSHYVFCLLDPIAVGETVTVTLRVKRVGADPITNTAYVFSDSESHPQNDEDSIEIGTQDTRPPVVTIDGGPIGTIAARSGTFRFSADEANVTFTCKLDGGALPCDANTEPGAGRTSGSVSVGPMSDGAHAFEVRATDASGNPSEPKSRTWTVDATGPTVEITSGPNGTVSSRIATFGFRSEANARFECSFDSRPFETCASGVSHPDGELIDRSYTFSVKAFDALNNEGPVLIRSWTVDGPDVVTTVAEPDEPVSTGTDAPTGADPVQAAIEVPGGGEVSLSEQEADEESPTGYSFFGAQVVISAPEATAEQPLRLTFDLDGSLLPDGLTIDEIVIFRNGQPLPSCPDATTVPADKEPACVTTRASVGDDFRITVITVRASTWNFGIDEGAPSASNLSALPAFQKAAAFNLSWSESTDAEGAAVGYDVRYSVASIAGGFGAEQTFQTSEGSGSATFTGQPGNTYCFFVRTSDASDNATDGPSVCTTVPLKATSMKTKGFAKKTGSGYYLNSFMFSKKLGTTLTSAVQAKQIALIVTKCKGCGTIGVYMGKTLLKKVNLHIASGSKKKQLLPIKSYAGEPVTGTITVKVLTSNKPVTIEGLGVSRA